MNDIGSQRQRDDFLRRVLAEDLGTAGDITTRAIFPAARTASAIIKSKQSGVLSGAALIAPLFALVDPALQVAVALPDGAPLEHQSVIARLEGPIAAILAGERTILNLLQHLSGVATQTAELVSLIGHTRARLLDTRKTTPLMRLLEKEAVRHGGGSNHRFGLFDMVLIKDTHVKAAGGPGNAVAKVKQSLGPNRRVAIEVEVQTVAEFQMALREQPDRIMLDNMSTADMHACVALRDSEHAAIELEASGNVSKATIVVIAETGVDFISVGSVTHSVKAIDIHLVIV